jgi:hypothetical protein
VTIITLEPHISNGGIPKSTLSFYNSTILGSPQLKCGSHTQLGALVL